jgi:coenzyme F420-reducing hydrogenase alpha subunit
MKSVDVNVNVHHLTRVEGHGNIVLDVKKGEIEKCVWEVVEAPRFFEAMVRGRKWDEMQTITSRICGICSISHSLVSLKATEAAFGITPSEQTVLLRRLLDHGENLQSHILHACYLVLPDLMGVGSVFPLIDTHTDAVLTVARVHRLANELCDLVGGRTTHPVSVAVNGFTSLPDPKGLEKFRQRCEEGIKDMQALADLVASVAGKIPAFERETEYLALTSDEAYALYDGDIASSDAGTVPVDRYLEFVHEYVVKQSTAKHSKNVRDSYMVGALARFNVNHEQLTDVAKKVAEQLGLKAPCHNPYMISVAQLVECVHSVEESIKLIDILLDRGLKPEPLEVKVKAGKGVAAIEAPRGLLIHDYEYDKNGVCVAANCVIPTNQNHGNIQQDMEALVPTILDKKEKEIELLLEMLVRAYDPCISCSTHLLRLKRK